MASHTSIATGATVKVVGLDVHTGIQASSELSWASTDTGLALTTFLAFVATTATVTVVRFWFDTTTVADRGRFGGAFAHTAFPTSTELTSRTLGSTIAAIVGVELGVDALPATLF